MGTTIHSKTELTGVREATRGESGSLPAVVRTIVVPFDGARLDRAPLVAAQALAARLDAEVVVLHIPSPSERARHSRALIGVPPAASATESVAQALEEAIAAMRATGLRARALEVAAPPSLPIRAGVEAALAEFEAMLFVTSTSEPACPPEDDHTAATLVACQGAPTLFVRPTFAASNGGGAARWLGWPSVTLDARRHGAALEPLRLLVGFDGSMEAQRALGFIGAFGRTVGARISLVRVAARSGLSTASGAFILAGAEALHSLDRAAHHLQAAGVELGCIRTSVRHGGAAEALLDQAAREDASVIVLPLHRPWHTRRSLSGVAGEVVARAPQPVLLLPSA